MSEQEQDFPPMPSGKELERLYEEYVNCRKEAAQLIADSVEQPDTLFSKFEGFIQDNLGTNPRGACMIFRDTLAAGVVKIIEVQIEEFFKDKKVPFDPIAVLRYAPLQLLASLAEVGMQGANIQLPVGEYKVVAAFAAIQFGAHVFPEEGTSQMIPSLLMTSLPGPAMTKKLTQSDSEELIQLLLIAGEDALEEARKKEGLKVDNAKLNECAAICSNWKKERMAKDGGSTASSVNAPAQMPASGLASMSLRGTAEIKFNVSSN
jgi:hypothetical protein